MLVVIVLCVSAPARLLTHLLPGSSIVLQGVSGTIWKGRAARCLIQMPGGFMQLGQTRWTVSPLSLLWFTPRVSIASRWGGQQLHADLTYHGSDHLMASAVEARVSAGLLQTFLPVALDGTLALTLESLEVRQGIPVSAVGRLVWESARWLSPAGVVPLGTYAIDSKQVDNDLQASILTLAGPLLADGAVRVSPARESAGYDLTLELGSEGAMDPQLQEALSLIAAPTDTGYRLVLQGQLP
jgi:hypothetical protein